MSTAPAYNKQYLPGYTGFVPRKNDVYGCTQGDINRIITQTGYKPSNYDVEVTQGKPQFAQRTLYSAPPEQDVANKALVGSNFSAKGENWIGGPTQNLQAQHIPGYSGFVPKIGSENLHGKSFARETGKAINHEAQARNAYQSTSQNEMSESQYVHLRDKPKPAELKDAQDADEFHDAE